MQLSHFLNYPFVQPPFVHHLFHNSHIYNTPFFQPPSLQSPFIYPLKSNFHIYNPCIFTTTIFLQPPRFQQLKYTNHFLQPPSLQLPKYTTSISSNTLSYTTGLWPGQPGLWQCKSFSIVSNPRLDGSASCRQLQVFLHQHFILHRVVE